VIEFIIKIKKEFYFNLIKFIINIQFIELFYQSIKNKNFKIKYLFNYILFIIFYQ